MPKSVLKQWKSLMVQLISTLLQRQWGGGGPAPPGCGLDKGRPPRPWEGARVDFEARLKYSQSSRRHPLVWAQPPWGPHSQKGDLDVSRPTKEAGDPLGFFSPLLFWGPHLTHPRAGILNLHNKNTPLGFYFLRFFFFFLFTSLNGEEKWELSCPRVE